MDEKTLASALQATPVTSWRAFDEIGSTNDEALAWLEADAPDFSLVIADSQSKGRGRFQRHWITQPGASLAFTVIFRLNDQEQNNSISLYAPLCGLAVWQALTQQAQVEAQIKWPNDILLARKKVCGILVEGAWLGNRLQGIVMGIGINIRSDALPPDSEKSLLFPATWLEAHASAKVDRFELLAAVLNSLADWRKRLGSTQFFNTWQEHLAFRGEQVQIEGFEKKPIIGTLTGIDSKGNLLLLLKNGQEKAIEVGDVHLRTNA